MIEFQQTNQSGIALRQSLLFVVMAVLIIASSTTRSYAQSADTFAPIIELEEIAEGVADQTQVFTVQIAEDVLLKDATLYYRREGQLPFTPAPMAPQGDTGYFSVSIPTRASDLRTIEYYVQARDEAGNRTVSGFAFDPYQRALSASPTSALIDPDPVSTAAVDTTIINPPLLKRRWVQITLGVLAVGALASLSGDDGADSEVVPLTFNLQ